MSELELDRILAFIDDDQNGYLTFGEFIVAAVNPKEILTKERLQACFKSFDEDGSGSVSLEEIKAVIGKQVNMPDHAWRKMMQFDDDGNAEMDYDEFGQMLREIFAGGLDDA